MESIEELDYKGLKIRIVPDDCEDNPREWDNLGTMVTWRRHGGIGDIQPKESPNEWIAGHLGLDTYADDYDESQNVEKFCKTHLVIPIMAYEHGGITIRAYNYGNWPDQQWDCGQLGFIYVSHEKIKKEWNAKRLTKAVLAKAEKCLLAEIETLDDYLTGNVVGYIVEDEDGNHLDSCYGFYGDDGRKEAMAEAKSSADYHAEQRQAEQNAMDQRLAIATAHS